MHSPLSGANSLLFSVLCTLALSARAQPDNDDKWRFGITLYVLAAGLSGTPGMRGVSAGISGGDGDEGIEVEPECLCRSGHGRMGSHLSADCRVEPAVR
jgi:hypothetical protein